MRFFVLFPLLAIFLVPFFLARAEPVKGQQINNGHPVLVELFTSQSCSSCPRAEKLFAEFSERDDLVVIEWHVDYWNNLVHGRAGHWVDPFSTRSNTQRQRDYNSALRNTGSVYTPQAVIAGYAETTGSRQNAIETLISQAPSPYAKVDVTSNGRELMVSVAPMNNAGSMQAEVMFVEMISSMKNKIHGGENKGRMAESRNIAIASDTLGPWTGVAETYRASLRTVKANHCAVLVQEIGSGQILGASYCPPMETVSGASASAATPDFIDAHP